MSLRMAISRSTCRDTQTNTFCFFREGLYFVFHEVVGSVQLHRLVDRLNTTDCWLRRVNRDHLESGMKTN